MIVLTWLEWPEKCFRLDAGALRRLKELLPRGARVVRARSERGFVKALPTATHVIAWNFRREWFGAAKRLELLATPAAGREFVPETGPSGVKIHFGHYHGAIMSESVAAFVLAWARGFFRPELAGEWPRNALSDKCYEVAGTRAVVVGYGHVGRAIGAKLEALGVVVSGITRHRPDLAALRTADWLVLALPSTTGTDDWLDAAKLRKLPRRCVVVNVGRGNCVDEKALYAALKAKRIAGAYLDVRKHEPSATVLESPGYVPELAKLPNCIVTPHVSAFSPRYLERCFEELKDDGCF